MDVTAVLVAALGVLASIGAAIVTARTARRGALAAESVGLRQVEADAYKRARESYDAALTLMQGEIGRLTAQVGHLQRQVSALTRQVRAAGLVPVTSSEEDAP
jgi:hypothetical protein